MALALLISVSWGQCETQVFREEEKAFMETWPLSPAGRCLGPEGGAACPAPDPTCPGGQRPPGCCVPARPGLEATLGATSAVPRRPAASLHTRPPPPSPPERDLPSTPLAPLIYLSQASPCPFQLLCGSKTTKKHKQKEKMSTPFTLPHGQTSPECVTL